MKTKIFYEASVFKDVEEDSYENGCIGNGYSTGLDIKLKADTLPGLLKELRDFLPGATFFIFDDRLDAQLTENAEGYEASEREIEGWKEGKIKLYLANYSFYVDRVERENVTHEILKEAFPELEADKFN